MEVDCAGLEIFDSSFLLDFLDVDDGSLEEGLVLEAGFRACSSVAIELFGLIEPEVIRAKKSRAKNWDKMHSFGFNERVRTDVCGK